MLPTEITSRTRITEPGVYTLGQDIERGDGTYISESCIRIEASNVIFDGRGHRIAGRGVSDTTGVSVTSTTGLENVVVANLTLTDWDTGLDIRDVTGALLHDVRIVGNGYGIRFESVRDVLLDTTQVSGNLLGVTLDPPSDDPVVRDTDIESNHGRDVVHRPCSTTAERQRSSTPGNSP